MGQILFQILSTFSSLYMGEKCPHPQSTEEAIEAWEHTQGCAAGKGELEVDPGQFAPEPALRPCGPPPASICYVLENKHGSQNLESNTGTRKRYEMPTSRPNSMDAKHISPASASRGLLCRWRHLSATIPQLLPLAFTSHTISLLSFDFF